MPRTWVLVEDNGQACSDYLETLLGDKELLRPGEKVYCLTSSGGMASLAKFTSPILTTLQIQSADAISQAFERVGSKELLVLLDVTFVDRHGIQSAADFNSASPTDLNLLWKKLHAEKTNQIHLVTQGSNAYDLVKSFAPDDEARFTADCAPLFSKYSGKELRKAVLDWVHERWVRRPEQSSLLLDALLSAQGIGLDDGGPAHPNSWSAVPPDFELAADFCGSPSDNLASFKALFWYVAPESKYRFTDDDEVSAAVFTGTKRKLHLQTLRSVLARVGVPTLQNVEDASTGYIRPPGAPGMCFVWRLVRFLEALHEPVESVTVSHGNDSCALHLKVPRLRLVQAAVLTRSEQDGGSVVDSFLSMITCAPPDVVPEAVAGQTVASWQTVVTRPESRKGRALVFPAVRASFDVANDTLTVFWKFDAVTSRVSKN